MTRITLYVLLCVFHIDEFKGHSLLQAAREADMAKVKKTLALEIISFKHPQTNETALVRTKSRFSRRFYRSIKNNSCSYLYD